MPRLAALDSSPIWDQGMKTFVAGGETNLDENDSVFVALVINVLQSLQHFG